MANEKPEHKPTPEDKAEGATHTQAEVYEANAAGVNPQKAAARRAASDDPQDAEDEQ